MSDVTIKIEEYGTTFPDEYKFTYTPSTIHVKTGQAVTFEIDAKSPGAVVPDLAWLIFDSQVVKAAFYLQLVGKTATPPAKFDRTGAQHYRFVGVKAGKLIADVWCPSIIVH